MDHEKINTGELARRWGVPSSWVRNHTRKNCSGPIPHVKLGSKVVFEWGCEALNEYWDDCKRGYDKSPVSEGQPPAEARVLVRRPVLTDDELKRIVDGARKKVAAVGLPLSVSQTG